MKTPIAIITARRKSDTMRLLTRVKKRLEKDFDFFVFTNDKKIYNRKHKDYELYGYEMLCASDEFIENWKKTSDELNIYDKKGFYFLACCNREFAVRTLMERGYEKGIFLDDNIINIHCFTNRTAQQRRNDIVKIFYDLVENCTEDTPLAGMQMSYWIPPSPTEDWYRGAYVYSFYCMRFESYKDWHFYNFTEDDILLNLWTYDKLGKEVVQARHYQYGKAGTGAPKDEDDLGDTTGARKAYNELGNARGNYISEIYPEFYQQRGVIETKVSTSQQKAYKKFRHRIVPLNKVKKILESRK